MHTESLTCPSAASAEEGDTCSIVGKKGGRKMSKRQEETKIQREKKKSIRAAKLNVAAAQTLNQHFRIQDRKAPSHWSSSSL